MRQAARAFTLVEALVTSSVLVILLGSVIMCNLFGLAMATRQQIWLGAADDAADAISMLTVDIRSGNSVYVGTYSNNSFTAVSITNSQTGNALKIYTTTNTYPWTMYYYDSTSNNLVRTNYNGPGVAGDYKLVSANPITNDMTHPIFTEIDAWGNTLSSGSPYAPISIYLSFTKLQNPQIVIENGSVVDLYTLTAVATPRVN
jgi:type II secretory pathway pseudopilin PulG